jgi:hypothetical protein
MNCEKGGTFGTTASGSPGKFFPERHHRNTRSVQSRPFGFSSHMEHSKSEGSRKSFRLKKDNQKSSYQDDPKILFRLIKYMHGFLCVQMIH